MPFLSAQDLFKALPQPKKATSHNLKYSEETEDEFLLKKETPVELPKKTTERKTTKIFLPSLSSVRKIIFLTKCILMLHY